MKNILKELVLIILTNVIIQFMKILMIFLLKIALYLRKNFFLAVYLINIASEGLLEVGFPIVAVCDKSRLLKIK